MKLISPRKINVNLSAACAVSLDSPWNNGDLVSRICLFTEIRYFEHQGWNYPSVHPNHGMNPWVFGLSLRHPGSLKL